MINRLNPGDIKLYGNTDRKIREAARGVLSVIDMNALADYYRNTMDMFATGEFWGKIMRALCLISEYTGDEKLKNKAKAAAMDMLSIAKAKGHISTVPVEKQPNGSNGSDLWERKYALMGLLYYYEMTGDSDVLAAAEDIVIYTESQVGDESGKTPITATGWAFCGIESSSILQPVMHLYNITKLPEAKKLADHIIGSGACSRENIFKSIENGKKPADIGGNGNPKESIAKAYEMMSCFEGLCEYARATGEKKYLDLVKLFWQDLIDDEITILGSGGADAPFNLGPGIGEQWNRARHEQTNPDIELMMETCVTVYWMRLSEQLFLLTGDSVYMDSIEKSIYNAIFGALRPDGCFFEYFPKLNGRRNNKVNYSFNIKGFDLSCCTANGPTALGMIPQLAFTTDDTSLYINLYEKADFTCKIGDGSYKFTSESKYPSKGRFCLKLASCSKETTVTFKFRVPGFAANFVLKTGNKTLRGVPGSYLTVESMTQPGMVFEVSFDIPVVMHRAPMGSNRLGDNFAAFTYGALCLARDSRDNENVDEPVDVSKIENIEAEPQNSDRYVNVTVTAAGKKIYLRDYQSAGSFSEPVEFRTWIPSKN